jgi:uncharacterized membrane protein YqhA
MIERILKSSRYMILIAVLGSLLASIALLIYGGIQIIYVIATIIKSGSLGSQTAKLFTLGEIQVIELYLLGTAFYIISLGLYELFINDKLELPNWLEIHNLDDLKSKLVSVIIVVLGVLFLGEAMNWDGESNLLFYGAAIALVIVALAYFLSQKEKKAKPPSTEDTD